jgi:hypothetical protein
MDRAELLKNLRALPLDLSRCWLTAGGALVLHGLRASTADIDLGCEPSLADELEAAGYVPVRTAEGNRRFFSFPGVDLSENFARGETVNIEGVPVAALGELLALKRRLNRPKDQRDIAALEAALGERPAP